MYTNMTFFRIWVPTERDLLPNIKWLPIGLAVSFLTYCGNFFLGVIVYNDKKGWLENGLGML